MLVRPPATPVATIKAYRRPGGGVVTIERPGRPAHRHCVSLKRYNAFREWTMFGGHPWRWSGGMSRSSMTASLWEPSPLVPRSSAPCSRPLPCRDDRKRAEIALEVLRRKENDAIEHLQALVRQGGATPPP